MIFILQIKSCTKESGLATLCRKIFAYIGRWNRSSTPFDTDNVADKGYSNVKKGFYQSFITKEMSIEVHLGLLPSVVRYST
jgi:hypothetical protein